MANELEYTKDRLEKQQKWHSDKATWNKKRYYFAEVVMIVGGSLIPVINVLTILSPSETRAASAILAAIVVIAVGINKLYNFQENWIDMRNVSETLARENELYKFGVGEYSAEKEVRDRILIEKVEGILASASSKYFAIQTGSQGGGRPDSQPTPSSEGDL